MAYELWSQDNFSKGELSPYMYARASVNQYYNGMKTAQNVLTYPTGGAGKRFGTLFQAINTNIPDVKSFYFQTYQYLNECVYQLVFYPLGIDIYLEGILIAQAVTTLNNNQVYNLSSTTLGAAFRISGNNFAPMDLTRGPSANNIISGYNGTGPTSYFTMTSPLVAGKIAPITLISATLALLITEPQVVTGVTYFARNLTTSTIAFYTNSYDAKFDTNRIQILAGSTFTTINIQPQNVWTLAKTVFKNRPYYDFNGVIESYDTLVFTPSAVNGNAVTISLSPAGYTHLSNAYIGGSFIGGGGVSRITAVAANQLSFTVAVETSFTSTAGILGSLTILAEPAWSDARGWPEKCSSYQNRSLFANTVSLTNGFWASVINDYTDFNDLETDDDSAISWFPSSDDVNYIRFIVPYRSITVHTNTGIYSSPLSDVAAITPSNFSLLLQDSTPADVLQPRAIDNQILVISGNDCHTMLWDGINNAYTSDIVSVINEQLIRDPVDETPYADLRRAGSRYIFIINANGSMAVYQTLLSQEVSGFTPQVMEQSYGKAQFRQAASSSDGRCWFITERDIPTAQVGIAITAFTGSTLTAVASGLSTTTPTAITFTTTGTLPASSTAINTTSYFWAIGVTADTFKVYASEADAKIGGIGFTFTSSGTNSHLVSWPLVSTFILEELNQDVQLDCAVYYNGTPASTIATGTLFNAQDVKMIGDGFGFDATGFGGNVIFEAHGVATPVSTAYIGFPINLIIEPMPLSMTTGTNQKQTALTQPKHVREVRFMFNNTIGGTINGVPIAISPFNQVPIGEPPVPQRGIFRMSVQKAWDDFKNPTFTIKHNEPFNIELLGVFYSVDV